MDVTQNSELNRFEVSIEGAHAVLDYKLTKGLMTITHTFVPPELRGQNIAGQLAKAAFDFAEKEALKVIPQCSYISTYAKRNPNAQRLLQ